MGDSKETSHSVSSETIIEAVVNGMLGTSDAGHNHHSSTVQDSHGNVGHGSGNSASEAQQNAVNDLNR